MLKNYTGNLRSLGRAYPRQFWLLMAGTLINTIGVGFVWPFLTIYLTDELGIALSLATMLPLMEQSVALVAALAAGSVADRYGRKGLMVVSRSAAQSMPSGSRLAVLKSSAIWVQTEQGNPPH